MIAPGNVTLEVGATKRLADFVAQLEYEELPPDVVQKAKLALTDAIGCAIYGSRTEWSRIIVDFVREQRSNPESSVIAHDFKASAPDAALANGTMIHSFELDDVANKAKLHPGAPIIPAVLAVGERVSSDGKRVLESIVVGYETIIRVSLGLGPASAKNRGWHVTGVCGTLGAAAASGKLLGLDSDDLASALGLGGTQSSGLFAFTADGSMSKRFHPGRAAQSGVIATLLSQKGFRGPTKILEAEDGGLLAAISDDYDQSRIFDGIGDKYVIRDTGFKFYSCCGSLHPALDAVKELMADRSIRAEDVERVIVGCSRIVMDQCGWPYTPYSILQAQMSLQYCIAVCMLEGDAFLGQFTNEKIRDPRIIDLARRVEASVDQEVDSVYPEKFSARVTFHLKDGKVFTKYVDEPTGLSGQRAATKKLIESKFVMITKDVIGERRAQQIVRKIDELEQLKNIRELTEMLQFQD